MGIFDRIFGGKKEAHDHHGHEHIECATCGAHFHTKAEHDAHQKSAHAK